MTRKKKLLIATLAVGSIAFIATLGLHFYLNSSSARQSLEQSLSKKNRRLSIGQHSFSFLSGISASDITFSESSPKGRKTYQIKSASINYNHFFYFRGLPPFKSLNIKDATFDIDKTAKLTAQEEPTVPSDSETENEKIAKTKSTLSSIPALVSEIDLQNIDLSFIDKKKTISLRSIDFKFSSTEDLSSTIESFSYDKISLEKIKIKSENSAQDFQKIIAIIAQESLKDEYEIQKKKTIENPLHYSISSQATATKSPLSEALQVNSNSSLESTGSFQTKDLSLHIAKLSLKSGNIGLQAKGNVKVQEQTIDLDLEQVPVQDHSLKIKISGSFEKPNYKSNNRLLNKLIFDKL